MSFNKTLLDRSLRQNLRVEDRKNYSVDLLPQPLQPTPYTPPKPVPKPRIKRGAPIALPRTLVPKKVTEKVKKIKKLIDEIAPYFAPEPISEYTKNLKFMKEAEIIHLKNNALSFKVTIIKNHDPRIQLADTRGILKEKLKTLIGVKRKGIKINMTLKVRLRKEREDEPFTKNVVFLVVQ